MLTVFLRECVTAATRCVLQPAAQAVSELSYGAK
jgi:hypothetical protein